MNYTSCAGGGWKRFLLGPEPSGPIRGSCSGSPAMEEPQPQHEGRPRRVRFRISSAGSGRLLKQVYEDGQELEPPAEERSRRFLRNSFEPEEPLCGPGELPGSADSLCWPTALTARRISVLRESQHQGLLGSAGLLRDCRAGPGLCGVSAG